MKMKQQEQAENKQQANEAVCKVIELDNTCLISIADINERRGHNNYGQISIKSPWWRGR